MHLDETDKALLALAEGDLDVCERPFDAWALMLGISVDEVLARLQALKQCGVIRDFKAILRHTRAGFTANAMVLWAVPEALVVEIGPKIAASGAVSHCYERTGFGRFTVFSMIHGKDREDIHRAIRSISQAAGIEDVKIFWSVRELKKTSMRYFRQEESGDE